jgi:phospholipase C
MKETDRRTFLKLVGTPAVMAATGGIARALEIPANTRTRSIADIEHIVILTQENRSFDHYFGTMRGVRGFADPRVMRLPSGQPVWFQPTDAGFLLPFRPANAPAQFLPDPPHGWNDGHAAWDEGRYDAYVPNKGITTMTHYSREDLPYYHALADAFTICDAYHCSVMGPTDPNRYHMWTGWVGNDGAAGGPEITNAETGYDWSTYPERLTRAGITWKCYQDIGLGLTAEGVWGFTGDPFIGNFGDNSLLYFHQYQNAVPGSTLYESARRGTNINALGRNPDRLMDVFRADVQSSRLPQISYIVAPEAYTEHPNWIPGYGEWYASQVVDILSSNPDLWSKTVLFINYDEEGGFFDHMIPPTPPASPALGASTVPITNEIFPGNSSHPSGPYGLGLRVPMIVVSPWTKGGWVDSQLFDHTSLIKFIEARFADDFPDLVETNITPWRRAVVGDLTSAFDFKNPERWKHVMLPSTDGDKPTVLERQDDDVPVPPAQQRLPRQERGVRPARALPYSLDVRGHVNVADGSVRLTFVNDGRATVVFHARSGHDVDAPRTYTVGSHAQLIGVWGVAGIGESDYDLSVHGPNGFLRRFQGGVASVRVRLDVQAEYDAHTNAITVSIGNPAAQPVAVNVFNRYTGKTGSEILGAGRTLAQKWNLTRFYGWYDLTITSPADSGFEYQLAGHLETGDDSVSDPLMGGLI